MANGTQPQSDPDLGGYQTFQQFLADRPGETPAVQPPAGSPDAESWGDMARGYGGAFVKGVTGALPIYGYEAAIGPEGWAAIPGTALMSGLGGVAEHAVEMNAPPGTPGWVAPAVGMVPGFGTRGVQALGTGALALGRQALSSGTHFLGAMVGGSAVEQAAQHFGAQAAHLLSNHIVASGLAAVPMAVGGGMLRLARNPGNLRNFAYPLASTMGATTERFINDLMPSAPAPPGQDVSTPGVPPY